MLLGTGKAVMTPPLGTWLAGYSNGRGIEKVLHELQLRVFWFQESPESSPGSAVCLITAELLGFGDFITGAIRADLSEKFGIKPEAVMLAASHTHCGPQTCENMPNNGGPLVPEFIDAFRGLIIETVAAALGNLRPTTLRIGRGELGDYAISRRLVIDGKALFAPSPQGKRDDEVTVIIASDAETDEVSAALFHYTCHPTLLGEPVASGDYPGVALLHIEQQMPKVCAGFLPGCFGDVRPNALLVGGKKFRPGTAADAQELGTALGDEVLRVVKANADSTVLHPQISSKAEVLTLPQQNEPDSTPFTLQRIELAKELGLIAMGGEMGVDYGYFVKALDDNKSWVPVGYANGLIGYVCPAHQYEEGGFEPLWSIEAYSLSSPFKPECEEIIHSAIRGIVG